MFFEVDRLRSIINEKKKELEEKYDESLIYEISHLDSECRRLFSKKLEEWRIESAKFAQKEMQLFYDKETCIKIPKLEEWKKYETCMQMEYVPKEEWFHYIKGGSIRWCDVNKLSGEACEWLEGKGLNCVDIRHILGNAIDLLKDVEEKKYAAANLND